MSSIAICQISKRLVEQYVSSHEKVNSNSIHVSMCVVHIRAKHCAE